MEKPLLLCSGVNQSWVKFDLDFSFKKWLDDQVQSFLQTWKTKGNPNTILHFCPYNPFVIGMTYPWKFHGKQTLKTDGRRTSMQYSGFSQSCGRGKSVVKAAEAMIFHERWSRFEVYKRERLCEINRESFRSYLKVGMGQCWLQTTFTIFFIYN